MRIPGRHYLMRMGALIWLSAAPQVSAATIFVDDSATGLNNGNSWVHAFVDLRIALNTAQAGDEIRVAGGLYRPDVGSGDPAMSFVIPSGVLLRGGYAGVGAPDPDDRDASIYLTTLSGDIGILRNATDNTFRIVVMTVASASTLIDGVTIADGRADGSFPYDRGGGLAIQGGAPVIRDCVLRDCLAISGGGVFVDGASAARFESCRFVGNVCDSDGAGLYSIGSSPRLVQCLFQNNFSAVEGGGASLLYGTPLIDECLFDANDADLYGGGLFVQGGNATITSTDFTDNTAINSFGSSSAGGGAIYLNGGATTIERCELIGNTAAKNGGGILASSATLVMRRSLLAENFGSNGAGALFAINGNVELSDCNVVGNHTVNFGGALLNWSGTMAINRCSIWSNRTYVRGGGVFVWAGTLSVRNSIFWGNKDDAGQTGTSQIDGFVPAADVSHNCIQGWSRGFGNINAAPMFLDGDGADNVPGTVDDDPRVMNASPCANSGDPAVVSLVGALDFYGNARVTGCRLDIGAYESSAATGSYGDINGDGLVDGGDIQPFVMALEGAATPLIMCRADLDVNGVVDSSDLLLLTTALLSP